MPAELLGDAEQGGLVDTRRIEADLGQRNAEGGQPGVALALLECPRGLICEFRSEQAGLLVGQAGDP